MKIAFISFEYPPDTGGGGIGTYARQAAHMLQRGGHHVEVFAASKERFGTFEDEGIIVHRLSNVDQANFGERVGPIFRARHDQVCFDVLEGPDCNADASGAVRLVPDIPLVVKLHTPVYIIDEIARLDRTFARRIRSFTGAIARRKNPFRPYDMRVDRERIHAAQADLIASPSRAIGLKVLRDWRLDTQLVSYYPYPYVPAERLLSIPIVSEGKTVTFLGRLEVRKGIHYLAAAIPAILRAHPDALFKFVGRPRESPARGMDMRQYLERKLGRFTASVEFTGPVPPEEIAHVLAGTDVCVFPSIWESFGFVCLEGMSAGRCVVGSAAGGMAELLEGGSLGRLVPPRNAQKIAETVTQLLDDPTERLRLGKAGRARVLSQYNAERVMALQIESYQKAIARRRELGPRSR